MVCNAASRLKVDAWLARELQHVGEPLAVLSDTLVSTLEWKPSCFKILGESFSVKLITPTHLCS